MRVESAGRVVGAIDGRWSNGRVELGFAHEIVGPPRLAVLNKIYVGREGGGL